MAGGGGGGWGGGILRRSEWGERGRRKAIVVKCGGRSPVQGNALKRDYVLNARWAEVPTSDGVPKAGAG